MGTSVFLSSLVVPPQNRHSQSPRQAQTLALVHHNLDPASLGLSVEFCKMGRVMMLTGFPGSSTGKESSCNVGDPSSIPGSGRFPWKRDRLPTPVLKGFPGGLDGKESTCNEGDLGSTLDWEDPLEEGMATHSGILTWRIPWTEEPGRLQSMGLQELDTT